MGDGRPRGGSHIENVRFWDLPKDKLQYIMKDAGEAMKANPTGRKAGKYADEVNDASTVLGWRKKAGIKEEVELDEDNMDLMRKAAKGAMQTIKFKDGKLKMDSFTASGIMAVYDGVNPKNKVAIENMINSGTKAQIMKLQSMAMKATEEAELDEVFKPGAKVKVRHKGKMIRGKVVRYDKGGRGESPFYVVDVGEYESPKIPAHKIDEEVELDEAEADYTIVAIKNNKVVDQQHSIAKSEFKDAIKLFKKNNPGAKISIEDKGGKIVHTEEVDLDEAKPEYEVKYAKSKSSPIKVTKFMTLDQAKEFLDDVKKDGMNGIISKGGKPVKEDVDLDEDNMDLMRKAADGAMQTIKFKDGKLKMDSFTASGIMQVYDGVNPKNKKSIEKMG